MDWLKQKTLGSNAASLARTFTMHGNHFFCIFSGFHYRWITRRRSYCIDCFFVSRGCATNNDTIQNKTRKKRQTKNRLAKNCVHRVCVWLRLGNCRSCGAPNKSNYPLFSVILFFSFLLFLFCSVSFCCCCFFFFLRVLLGWFVCVQCVYSVCIVDFVAMLAGSFVHSITRQ